MAWLFTLLSEIREENGSGNFYVPKGAPKALPTILYLCGHSPHPLGAKFQYQDRALWFASHGFACLVLDTHEFGF